jgi:signal peptidase I
MAVWEVAGVAVVAVAVIAGVLGIALRWLFAVITVDGLSMQPTLNHGDRLLVRRTSATRIRSGQIVLVQRPDPRTGWSTSGSRPSRVDGAAWYVKRAVAVAGDPVPPELAARCTAQLGTQVPAGKLLVIGDNPLSDDSKKWGYCPDRLVFGVVLRTMRDGARPGPAAQVPGPGSSPWPVPPPDWVDEDDSPPPPIASSSPFQPSQSSAPSGD